MLLLVGRRVGVVLRILAAAPDGAERQGRERQQKEDKPQGQDEFFTVLLSRRGIAASVALRPQTVG